MLLKMIWTQIWVQMIIMLHTPIFWIAFVVLLLQIGMHIWDQERWVWKEKQVRHRLPAFFFTVFQLQFQMIFLGLFGGACASVLLLLIGCSIDYTVIPYLWVMILLLLSIRRRFVCIAYASGLLVCVQFFLGLFHLEQYVSLDARSLLMMVAILHVTEAFLVWISGTMLAKAVYSRDKSGNTTIGIHLNMTWLIPIVIPVLLQDQVEIQQLQYGCLVMPEWWPLFDNLKEQDRTLYQLTPMLATIGYRDFSVCGMEHQQTRKTAVLLLCYSLLLSGMVFLSRQHVPLLPMAASFCVLGHEAMLRFGQKTMRKYTHEKKEQ